MLDRTKRFVINFGFGNSDTPHSDTIVTNLTQAVKSDRCIPDQSMIVGAIDHHIKTHGCKLRQTECLDLTKTFSGFLLIGPTRAFDMNLYCGPTLSFNTVCDLEDRDSQVGI